MRTRRVLGIVVMALVPAACERELTSQETTTTIVVRASTASSSEPQPTTTAVTVAPTTPGTTAATPTTAAATTAAPTTIPVVSSDIVGIAVAGNSGGVGADQTDSFSEAIRNEDGSCSGWTGRDVDQPWTAGLESGAAFVVLPRDGHDVIGQGTLGPSSFVNVGTEAEPQ